jgi:hypothetical protein
VGTRRSLRLHLADPRGVLERLHLPSVSGLGVSLEETDRRVRVIERFYRLLPDTRAVLDEWRQLIVAHGVMGVQVHDARLVAAMNVHQVSHVLTFNVSDFTRYPGITAAHPQTV